MTAAAPMKKLHGKLVDPFTAEILRNYLISTVREMVTTTVRTAYSTCFSEGEDFTCALFDARGRMVAQTAGLPVHVGGLTIAVEHFMSKWPEFQPGDVILHNDPYTGGSHQADATVCRPIFFDGTHVGFAVNRGHWTDIGGMAPGGWSGTARHVVQEALLIPAVKLYDAGRLNADIREFILRNVRLPRQMWGDLQAQIASSITAERRVTALIEKYGLDAVLSGFELAQDYSKRRFLKAMQAMPDATVDASDIYMEDDGFGGGPYRVTVTITKTADGIVVDFEGTDPQAAATVNCTRGIAHAGAYAPIMAALDPGVPVNQGLLDLIEVRSPQGSLVDPVYPAPCFAATGDPVHRISEIMQLALARLLPDRVIASSFATGNNMTGWGYDPKSAAEFLWYVFESGGVGARATKDGNSADWFVMANCKNESMEVWEQRYPVRFRAYELVTDSAGAGRWRGGLGTRRAIELTLPTSVTANADRHQRPGPGYFGGESGSLNRFTTVTGGREQTFSERFGTPSPSKFSNLPLDEGDILVVTQAGGAGYGDPLERDAALVAHDVAEGYVSREAAAERYAVAIGSDGTVNRKATANLRARRRGASNA